MTIPAAFQGTQWKVRAARAVFPMLVWCAQRELTIAYSELDDELVRRGLEVGGRPARLYGNPAGVIGEALLAIGSTRGEAIPPINALVVNKNTGLPGAGCDYYLTKFKLGTPQRKLSSADRKAMAEDTFEEIWRYQNWPGMLGICGLAPLKGDVAGKLLAAAPRKPTKAGWASGPESPEHRALKEWVARNPSVVGGTIPYPVGTTEWTFASADRADVMFEHPSGSLAVEVKAAAAGEAELERGIYQCVKYRALLRAELKAEGRVPNGLSLLVIESILPPFLRRIAARLGVPVIVVPEKRVG